MIRTITVEREFGAGGAAIAEMLAERLGWKLWDQNLTALMINSKVGDELVVRAIAEDAR